MNTLARSTTQLGTIIRNARKSIGLSQTQLGELAGLRQASISAIESGKPSTRLDTLMSVLAALDLELSVTQRSKSSTEDLESIF
jgi:HTH-type transcriptional regulator/antitoxin HipB